MRIILLLIFCAQFAIGATWYLDPVTGNDSNAGTSVGQPKRTASSILRTNMNAGDVCYVSPSAPIRECITLLKSWAGTTASDYARLIGDPWNTSGFTNADGTLVAPGVVRWTAWTNSDTIIPAMIDTLNINGLSNLFIANIRIDGPPVTGRAIKANGGACRLWISNCVLIASGSYALDFSNTGLYPKPTDCTIDRSFLWTFAVANALSVIHASGSSGDYDMRIIGRDSVFFAMGNKGAGYLKNGSLGGVGGGGNFTNCTFIGTGGSWVTGNSSTSSIPAIFEGCNFWGQIVADAVGQVTLNNSVVNYTSASTTPNTTLGTGTHTNDWWGMGFDFGTSQMMGFGPRPFWSQLKDSPLIGAGSNWTPYDMYGKPRATTNTWGPFELWTAPQRSSF